MIINQTIHKDSEALVFLYSLNQSPGQFYPGVSESNGSRFVEHPLDYA
jgi:hypothetical protein